jgi:nitroreductase
LGAYDEDAVKKVLDIPDEIRVPAMFTLGYADENPDPRPRKELNEILCFEKYK